MPCRSLMLWYTRNKTLRDILLLENNQLQSGKFNSASSQATLHHSIIDYVSYSSAALLCFIPNITKPYELGQQ